MYPIWHLNNIEQSILLYKSDNAHFIVTQAGQWTPILTCSLFIVINEELLSFFQLYLDEMPKTHPVSIYDYELKEYFEGYHRIYISDLIDPETVGLLDYKGKKVWRHWSSGMIFISSKLKTALDQSGIKGLETHEGFSWFAGSNE